MEMHRIGEAIAIVCPQNISECKESAWANGEALHLCSIEYLFQGIFNQNTLSGKLGEYMPGLPS